MAGGKNQLERQGWAAGAGEHKAKPVGEKVGKEGSGWELVKCYSAFELAGKKYELESSVLVNSHPDDECKRPYVGIIKRITEKQDESVHVLFQWLYRPEEAKNSFGGAFCAADARELYYSYHEDEVPAECVMHKCVVHFIPHGKQFPQKSKFKGHVVRRIYDRHGKRLWKLTDKDYKESNQEEIQKLLEKTRLVVGDLPDDVHEQEVDAATVKADRRRKLALLVKQEDVRVRAAPEQQQNQPLQKSPGKSSNLPSKDAVPASRNAPMKRDEARNRCRNQLFEALVRHVSKEQGEQTSDARGKEQPMDGRNFQSAILMRAAAAHYSGIVEPPASPLLPDIEAALVAANALEICVHAAFSSTHQYNLKIRSLVFNLGPRTSGVLARRLLLKELSPDSVLQMTPAELKAGYTSAEQAAQACRGDRKEAHWQAPTHQGQFEDF